MIRALVAVSVSCAALSAFAGIEDERSMERAACEAAAPALWKEFSEAGERLRREARELKKLISRERARLTKQVNPKLQGLKLSRDYFATAVSRRGGYQCEREQEVPVGEGVFASCRRRLADGTEILMAIEYERAREQWDGQVYPAQVYLAFTARKLEEFPERRVDDGHFLSYEAVASDTSYRYLRQGAYFKVRADASLGTPEVDIYSSSRELIDPAGEAAWGTDGYEPSEIIEEVNINFAEYVRLTQPGCVRYLYPISHGILNTGGVLINGLNVSSDDDVRFVSVDGQTAVDGQCLEDSASSAR